MARIILYTGKGGVGKTSVSAATAVRCADMGYRTIVLSTDAAHSLGDSFDIPLGATPTPIASKLWGQEIDVLHQMDEYWGTVQDYLSGILVWRGADGLLAQEASVLPGMEELASLLQITHLYASGEYDVIIVDCAPTGETLKFLSFPEAARWYRLAADSGNATAQYNLGILYAKGEGVPLDNVLAHMWINLAAVYFTSRLPRDRAIAIRETIARKLTPAEIVRAQQMAREWQIAKEHKVAPEWRSTP